MTEMLHVNGSTALERHGVTAAVDAILQACGAAVTDYHQFSNVSVSVSFEVEAGRLEQLRQGLEAAGVSLAASSVADLDRLSEDDSGRPIDGTVQVTFYHHEPDPHVRRHETHRHHA